jgi:glyoxylase-like metal-dependent hydrolase (beta-lactamase superfamily II)
MNKKPAVVVVGDIQTNCWIYRLEDEEAGPQSCIVIDPGDEANLIVSRLQKLNLVPRYVFLTHGHFDHLAALPGLIEAAAKGAFGQRSDLWSLPKVGIHRLDAHYLGKGALGVHRESMIAAGGSPAYVDALWKPLPDADIIFEEGDTAGPFKILHIPGHTQGSVGFYDEKTGVLFSGDTLFRAGRGRTDLPGGSEAQIYQSLKRLLSMKGEIAVYPGHGPATTITREAGI